MIKKILQLYHQVLNSKRISFVLIILITLSSIIVYMMSTSDYKRQLKGDEKSYNNHAIAMLENTEYLTSYESKRPPIYPAVIALVYQIAGVNNHLAIKSLNGFFIYATAVLIYLIGLELFNSRKISLISALWCGTYSHFLFISNKVLRESLLAFLLVSIIYLTILYTKRVQIKHLYFFILLMAVLVHTDPKFLAFIPVPIICILFTSTDGSLKRLKLQKKVLVYFGLILLLLVPWTVRNYWVYDRFVLLTPNLGSKLALDPIRLVEKYYEETDRMDLYNKSYSLQERLWFKVTAVPFQFLDFWRFARFRGEYRPLPDVRYEKPWSLNHNASMGIQFGLLLPLFIYGLMKLWKRKGNYFLVLILPILTLNIIHVIQHAKPRYRIPIEPLIFLIAFYGLSELWSRYKPSKYRK